ncbi:hypothetical protein BH11PSE14_BH11PSE14_05750 [soil metagenome]
MILRRLTQSLKEQNWTAIWVEFVLVVAGVFLGIQVANWNAAQQDHQREAEFVARLGRDFDKIDARLAGNISRWETKADAPLRVLADLDAFRQLHRWPRPKAGVLTDLNDTFNGRIPAPRSATYIELLSAGQLGLIRNTKLRDALLEYDMQVGYSQVAYSVLVSRVDPQMTSVVSHLQFDRTLSAANASLDSINENVWADVDLPALATDPKVEVALNMFASASRNQLVVAKLQQQKALAVMAILRPGAKRPGGKKP